MLTSLAWPAPSRWDRQPSVSIIDCHLCHVHCVIVTIVQVHAEMFFGQIN